MMSFPIQDLVFLILQFLDEEKFKETVHKLEQESGVFFNLKYFEDQVRSGDWDSAERYLSGFTKMDDNQCSMQIFFEIRKQRYRDALGEHDRLRAVDILIKDLKVFATFKDDNFDQTLLTLENLMNDILTYGDAISEREAVILRLKKLIVENPLIRNKLQFPGLQNSRLRTLINQSLYWQHRLCNNTRPNPDIETLFVDHSCGQPNVVPAPSPLGLHVNGDAGSNSKIWNITEINEPSQCRSLRLSETAGVNKISRLMYTKSGSSILALASNAVHLVWKWPRSKGNSCSKATASMPPQPWQPSNDISMENDIAGVNLEEAVPCFALSKNGDYLISASGGTLSLFNVKNFKLMATFRQPPPAATFVAFYHRDNNIIAIGMDDSTIQIYKILYDEIKSKLEGHSKRISGLAFSEKLNVLVSSGADAQICVWDCNSWERQRSIFLPNPIGTAPSALIDTQVEFHKNQLHLLVFNKTLLAIYGGFTFDCTKQWVPRHDAAPISHATFSSDSMLVYCCFLDASVCVFSAMNLKVMCRINRNAYLPTNVSNLVVHPVVVAAHPQEPNQFALGLSDGGVHVIEPLESQGKWGTDPPFESGRHS